MSYNNANDNTFPPSNPSSNQQSPQELYNHSPYMPNLDQSDDFHASYLQTDPLEPAPLYSRQPFDQHLQQYHPPSASIPFPSTELGLQQHHRQPETPTNYGHNVGEGPASRPRPRTSASARIHHPYARPAAISAESSSGSTRPATAAPERSNSHPPLHDRPSKSIQPRTEMLQPIEATRSYPPQVTTAVPFSPPPRPLMIRTDTYVDTPPGSNPKLCIIMELPGCKKRDIEISLYAHPIANLKSLQVQGCSRPPPGYAKQGSDAIVDDGETLRRERKYGNVKRNIRVPESIEPADVDAKLEDGVLTIIVHLPPIKTATSTPIHLSYVESDNGNIRIGGGTGGSRQQYQQNPQNSEQFPQRAGPSSGDAPPSRHHAISTSSA